MFDKQTIHLILSSGILALLFAGVTPVLANVPGRLAAVSFLATVTPVPSFAVNYSSTPPATKVIVTARVTRNANLRAGPGETYRKISMVAAGTTVILVDTN